MTEEKGSPRPRTGSGAACICKDEDQDVLRGWWWCLCAGRPRREGANDSRRSTYEGSQIDNEASLGPETKESDCSTD